MAAQCLELSHKRAIQELYPDLVDNVSTKDVLDYIFAGGWLSLNDKETIEKTVGEQDKTRKLLDMLLCKPRGAFDQLVYALRERRNQVHQKLSQKVKDIEQIYESK